MQESVLSALDLFDAFLYETKESGKKSIAVPYDPRY